MSEWGILLEHGGKSEASLFECIISLQVGKKQDNHDQSESFCET